MVDTAKSLQGGLNKHEGFEHIISYNDGIEVDFVLANGSVPINYEFTKLAVEDTDSKDGIKGENARDIRNGNRLATATKKVRCFWDGGIIANTLLREAVIEHRKYWHFVRKSEVPPLRAFVVNVHPIKQDSLPADYDALVDRKNDLTYHDRTLFDVRMAVMISDYNNLVNSLIKLAEDNGINKASIDKILDGQPETTDMFGKRRKYSDLIDHMVSIEQVIRIERANDVHTIPNKTFDFSQATIRQLLKGGYEETLDQEAKLLKIWDSEHAE